MKQLITTAVMAVLACVSMSATASDRGFISDVSVAYGSLLPDVMPQSFTEDSLVVARLTVEGSLIVRGDTPVVAADVHVNNYDFGGALRIRQFMSISQDQALVNAEVAPETEESQSHFAFSADNTVVTNADSGEEWRVSSVTSAVYGGVRVVSVIVDRVRTDNLAEVTVTVKDATALVGSFSKDSGPDPIKHFDRLHKGGLERRDVRTVLRNMMDQESEIVSVEVTGAPEANSIRLIASQGEESAETRVAVTGDDYDGYRVVNL